MVFQRLLNPERLATLIAGERLRWLRPLVMPEVILKRLLFAVRPFAVRTREGQGCFACFMTRKVVFQRLLFVETSATLFTRERLLVDLHVFRQVSFQMKSDVALLAGELLLCLGLFLFEAFPLHSTRLHVWLFSAAVCRSWRWREEMYNILI